MCMIGVLELFMCSSWILPTPVVEITCASAGGFGPGSGRHLSGEGGQPSDSGGGSDEIFSQTKFRCANSRRRVGRSKRFACSCFRLFFLPLSMKESAGAFSFSENVLKNISCRLFAFYLFSPHTALNNAQRSHEDPPFSAHNKNGKCMWTIKEESVLR